VPEVILTHNHGDHTGGLLTLRREIREDKFRRASPAPTSLQEFSSPACERTAARLQGWPASNAITKQPAAASSSTAIRGTVSGRLAHRTRPRKFPSTTGAEADALRTADGPTIEDTRPEDQSLVIDTENRDAFSLVIRRDSDEPRDGSVESLRRTSQHVAPMPAVSRIATNRPDKLRPLFRIDHERLIFRAVSSIVGPMAVRKASAFRSSCARELARDGSVSKRAGYSSFGSLSR